jgi:hypothetical protein
LIQFLFQASLQAAKTRGVMIDENSYKLGIGFQVDETHGKIEDIFFAVRGIEKLDE